MTIKTFVFCSLVLGSFPLQLQAKKNAFANEKIDHNFIKFTTVEIINDFQKAIGEYNANRKNPNALSGSIDSPFYRTKLESNLKGKNELPEIIKSDGYYSLHDGPNTIQFSIDLILKNQFYLNGKIYSLDKDSKNFDPKFFSTYFHKVIDFLITQSMAGEEFIASPESTRLLVAGIIALDGSFEKIGITCVFSCKEKASKINNDKLVKRINEYTEECEKNLGDQAHTFDLYNRTKDLFDISDIVTVG
ncbi:MAG: hypothetical protein ACXVCE_08390, partial [Bacteriovorax sp.]